MKLSSELVARNLSLADELLPLDNKNKFKKILGLATGNKDLLEKISLNEILILLENLGEILDKELSKEQVISINLDSCEMKRTIVRRAI